MIKNIIFDFGDIFINLDKQAPFKEMAKFGYTTVTPIFERLAQSYEMGLLETDTFLDELNTLLPGAKTEQIKKAWNAIILDFPEYRLKFIEQMKADNKYRLFLLSNTNDLHIDKVKESMGIKRFNRFKDCFEVFYLSQEMKMRKPNADIYEFVLTQNSLVPKETFFVDDTKDNTDSATSLGLQCWNLRVGIEDIVQLKEHL